MAGEFNRCRRCGSWGWDLCSCKEFSCWLEESGEDDADTIWAKGDAEVAAEKYLDYCMSERDGWEWIKNDESYAVFVNDGSQTRRYSVNAFLVWRYSAEEQAAEDAA